LERVSLKAPAKINLYLRVLGKLPDGYHEIESLMQAIDLYDDIIIEKSNSIELRCSDPSLPTNNANLAFRAAKLLCDKYHIPGANIQLVKRIPTGAGLGGGSSDAAFVIRGLCELYDIKPHYNGLLEMAGLLGSDVPFFFTGGQALARGRGEILSEVESSLEYQIALLSPVIAISTAEIYGSIKKILTKRSSPALLNKTNSISGLISISNEFHNDLEDVVLTKYPFLEELKRSLLGAGAFYSSMTGSGSSFFGLFTNDAVIPAELENLKESSIRVFKCRPILLPPQTGLRIQDG
jgi:4-diphosphocytidyl-2-C-methyl-D-erythritol kinase